MSRKKKTQEKTKSVDVEAQAEIAPKKAPRGGGRVVVDSREKAREVISAVSIALLETHPELPDTDIILSAFAEHYRSADARREEAAAAAAERAELERAQAAAEKKTASRRTVRPPAWVAPVAAPVQAALEPDPEPMFELPPLAVAAEPEPAMIDLQPEPSSVFADDAPLFGDEDIPAAEDIFASLGKSKESKDSDDFGFGGASEYSDPFIALPPTSAMLAEPDERTVAVPAFEDVEAAIAEEAAPTDRTTMIQAMPDDDAETESADGGEADPGADTADAGATKSRRSRKSSTRKKR